MYAFNMCIRIRQGDNQIDASEWRALLTGASKKLDQPKPDGADWLTDASWNGVQNMAALPCFGQAFVDDFATHVEHYKAYFDSPSPEEHAHMEGWNEKLNSLQKLIVLRAIRPDKVVQAMQMYISEHLDDRFLSPPPFDLGPCFEDSTPTVRPCHTPIPWHFTWINPPLPASRLPSEDYQLDSPALKVVEDIYVRRRISSSNLQPAPL